MFSVYNGALSQWSPQKKTQKNIEQAVRYFGVVRSFTLPTCFLYIRTYLAKPYNAAAVQPYISESPESTELGRARLWAVGGGFNIYTERNAKLYAVQ